MHSIYVVATGQHVGKTMVSLGLVSFFSGQGHTVGFFKPVGQQVVEKDGQKIDKDAVLMQSALGVRGALADMSPVTIPRGFVEEYLFRRDPARLRARVLDAYARLRQDCDVMVIEGTGHAGVGASFDLSNAEVAALLGVKVLLIVEGGIGSTLDQVAVNLSLLQTRHVDVVGVVANKIIPEKKERIARALEQGLTHMGLKFLGAVPYDPSITYPRVEQVAEAVDAEVLCGEETMGRRVKNILIAAMAPQNVLPRIKPRSLMITPGDRVDNILVALNTSMSGAEDFEGLSDSGPSVAGLVLTGGMIPPLPIVHLLKESRLPVIMCKEDTYEVASRVQNLVFKILPEDTDKIHQAQNLVKLYVNTQEILAALSERSEKA